jgi:diguanylate cyclase (GGDEF)-like protein/PAS domain S-box-containing protein
MNEDRVSRARYQRERLAREEAERLLELKSRDLYLANQKLEAQTRNLSHLVEEKTRALSSALEESYNALLAMRQTEAELLKSERKFRLLVEEANDIVFTLDTEGVFIYLSPRVEAVLGYLASDLVGQRFMSLVHPDDLPVCESFLDTLLDRGKSHGGLEYRIRHSDGEWHWHESNAAPLLDADQQVLGILGIARDIRDRKSNEQELFRLANFDTLTGLANRKNILERLETELTFARHRKRKMAVMFLDLNNFKSINDTHGHAVGDLVLQTTASRLQAAVRGYTDAVGRLAGDEFLIVLPEIKDRDTAVMVCNRIRASVSEKISVGDKIIRTDVSIGVSLYPQDGENIDALVGHADTAMYAHKAAKSGSAVFYRFGEPV